MTDARFPDRWLSDLRFQEISSEDFRAYSFALMWSVANRTDGRITPPRLRLIPTMTEDAPAHLVAAGLWVTEADGWRIEPFETTQSTREQLDAAEQGRLAGREQDRIRQRRHRDRIAAAQPSVTTDVTRDVTPEIRVTSDRDPVGKGKGQGQGALDGTTSKTDSAPPAAQRCDECGRPSSFSLVPSRSRLICRSCLGHLASLAAHDRQHGAA